MGTETVTVLFTDLVGSTALMARVGPERAEALRVEHFTLLRSAVVEHEGQEVKNLGDGLMVTFGAVSRAVDSAVAMQQAFESRNRTADEPMLIRVGLSMGEADVDGDDRDRARHLAAQARDEAATRGFGLVASHAARLLA